VLDGAFGEVRYAVAVKQGDTELREALDRALDELARDGSLRKIYERWGLWNAETARLLGDPRETSSAVPEAWEAWRAAVGKKPPFWERVKNRYPSMVGLFARGAGLTLLLSLASMSVAIVLGVSIALVRSYGPRPLRWIAACYVEFFRGTPLLVQLTMVYFGLPELGVTLDPFVAGVIALGLNYAAAEAENYRAGLTSVAAGQIDAARVLGLGTLQTIRWVVGPQAARVAIPPMTNDFIAMLKDSSLVSLVTLTELTKTYTSLANSTRDHLGLGVVVALWYLVIGLPFARVARLAEERLGKHLGRAAA
jgi:polar amino acid transport system substrate-binding protein